MDSHAFLYTPVIHIYGIVSSLMYTNVISEEETTNIVY